MLPEDIIIEPVITEKSNDSLQAGKYTFKVNKKATKVDIARAVEKLFDVRVVDVNTITVNGKQKRVGRSVGKTSDWKKAIVSIDTDPQAKSYLTKGGKAKKVGKTVKNSIDAYGI
jgi:large subunit ribosomal protein L23